LRGIVARNICKFATQNFSMNKLALVGNPNCGKTSLFNALTGLNQKVGNYPGVTVDKRSGKFATASGKTFELIDLPGTYSLSSNSLDEEVVQRILLNPENDDYPDLILMVVDATNLQRNLFLASQIYDLNIPMILVLNMVDVLDRDHIELDIIALGEYFDCPIVPVSAKKKRGIEVLKESVANFETNPRPRTSFFEVQHSAQLPETIEQWLPKQNDYQRFKICNQISKIDWIQEKDALQQVLKNRESGYALELQEINTRYAAIHKLVEQVKKDKKASSSLAVTDKIDRIVTHPVWGLFVFLLTFFIIFQVIFTFAAYPMDWIDMGMAWLGEQVSTALPEGLFNDFLVNGLIAGIGGVLVFLPQIMLLFGMVSLLEDTGYLARVSHMSDGMLRRFGMNGKSVIPLVSGFACAIPAIMAARTIENRKERLITIFITPLMSCSARLPVYVFLVAFLVPDEKIWGFLNLQGLMMMAMYLLGLVVSFLVALIINFFLRKQAEGTFLLELPNYKVPSLRNAYNSMINKGMTFVKEAGKIIVIAAVVIWALGNIVPSAQKERIEEKYALLELEGSMEPSQLEYHKNSEMLEYSYLGSIGKTIEPAIQPLGFDWKIGIAIAASFAAREVFVGTMATIYAVEDDPDSPRGLKAIKFSYPVAFSLLIFYVFALQCMSTIAIVRQETGGWKWPFIQFISFTGLAYFAAWLTYVIVG
jgi:ferrous iron transport protein B